MENSVHAKPLHRSVSPETREAWVYLLECADGTLYCGWSTDPSRRLAQHQAGTASRYTRSRLPLELVWSRRCVDRSAAMREEIRIKRLSAAAKRDLIAGQAGVSRRWVRVGT
jgi:putative endonuclease